MDDLRKIQSEMERESPLVKIVIVGDQQAGKSCLVASYLKKTFTSEYKKTNLDIYKGIKMLIPAGKREDDQKLMEAEARNEPIEDDGQKMDQNEPQQNESSQSKELANDNQDAIEEEKKELEINDPSPILDDDFLKDDVCIKEP